MHKLKSAIFTLLLGIGLAASFTFAASIWQGTDWIADGQIISADKIKANFDYLHERSFGGSFLPPTCIGGDKALQWDGSDWDCATIGEEVVESVALINGTHTAADCDALGGNTRNTSSGYICQLTASSCPSGWSQYANWTATIFNRCSAPGYGNCVGHPDLECITSMHVFSNQSTEICRHNVNSRAEGGKKCTVLRNASATCTASITQVGCK